MRAGISSACPVSKSAQKAEKLDDFPYLILRALSDQTYLPTLALEVGDSLSHLGAFLVGAEMRPWNAGLANGDSV